MSIEGAKINALVNALLKYPDLKLKMPQEFLPSRGIFNFSRLNFNAAN